IESQFAFDGLQRIRVKYGTKASLTANYQVKIDARVSTDNGATWTSIGTHSGPKDKLITADFSPNIPRSEKVRLRLVNISDGPTNNWGTMFDIVSLTVEQPE